MVASLLETVDMIPFERRFLWCDVLGQFWKQVEDGYMSPFSWDGNAESKYEWLPQKLPNISFQVGHVPESLYILCPPRSLVTKEDEIIPCFFEIMTITNNHYNPWSWNMNEPGFHEVQVPPPYWVAPARLWRISTRLSMVGKWMMGWLTNRLWWSAKLKRWRERVKFHYIIVLVLSASFLQGMSSYDCSYDIWCSNYIYVMVESCLIQEMHSVIIPYLIPYYHQPENQELDPIKAATHNVSQLTNEHGTVCSLMQVGTRLLSIFQLDTWTSYMTPSNIHANGLKMLKESDEGRIL